MSNRGISRRRFTAGASLLAAGVFTRTTLAQASRSPNEKLNVAIIGAGGRGAENVKGVMGENIVALCDVDQQNAAWALEQFPKAKRYTDYRRMLEQEKGIDAVTVSTPDHHHAPASIMTMRLGKHVYCEKPLTHTIHEARMMRQVAGEMKVATQMGTQGHGFEGTRRAVEVLRSGAIGDVSEVHVWTDRPANWWPQGVDRPTETPEVPKTLDWDFWLGPAPQRPYNPAYVPFKWRGFWDFGTGAIGDMGIHILDTAYWGLELGLPESAEVKDSSGDGTSETPPKWSMIELKFRGKKDKPIKVTWYDSGKLPPRELFQGEQLIGRDGGSLVIGSKGTMFTRTWHGGDNPKNMFVLLPRKSFEGYSPPPPSLPRTKGHHDEWIAACKGGPMTQSNFAYASQLTESLLLGNLALRTGKKIEWDAANMRAINCPEADQFIRKQYRKGWEI